MKLILFEIMILKNQLSGTKCDYEKKSEFGSERKPNVGFFFFVFSLNCGGGFHF